MYLSSYSVTVRARRKSCLASDVWLTKAPWSFTANNHNELQKKWKRVLVSNYLVKQLH